MTVLIITYVWQWWCELERDKLKAEQKKERSVTLSMEHMDVPLKTHYKHFSVPLQPDLAQVLYFSIYSTASLQSDKTHPNPTVLPPLFQRNWIIHYQGSQMFKLHFC